MERITDILDLLGLLCLVIVGFMIGLTVGILVLGVLMLVASAMITRTRNSRSGGTAP